MSSFYQHTFDTCMSAHIGSLNEEKLDEIFEKHDKDNSGYIEANELDAFIAEIFTKEISKEELNDFKTILLERLDNNNDGKLDKQELKAILPTENNFLMQFSNCGKNLCGIDFVKIWNHYDKNKNGILEDEELDGFLRDLILKCRPQTKNDQRLKTSIDTIKKSLFTKKAKKSENGLNKAELFDYLKVEDSCLRFEGQMTDERFDEEFAKYDKDNNGVIEGDELADLLSHLCIEDSPEAVDHIKDVILLKLDTNRDNKVQKSELKAYFNI